MTELILTLAIISFGTLFGMSLISLRKVELENKKLREKIYLDRVIENTSWNLLEK